MQSEKVERLAKRNLDEGERWHKKLSIKEIVFGYQDNSIAILAMLAGVTGGSLQRKFLSVGVISRSDLSLEVVGHDA